MVPESKEVLKKKNDGGNAETTQDPTLQSSMAKSRPKKAIKETLY